MKVFNMKIIDYFDYYYNYKISYNYIKKNIKCTSLYFTEYIIHIVIFDVYKIF